MIVDRQTHAHTNTQTDRQTDTLITIGPTPRSPIEGGVTIKLSQYILRLMCFVPNAKTVNDKFPHSAMHFIFGRKPPIFFTQ